MAVVRVKRRLSVEPVEALIIACKRVRTAVNDDEKIEDVKNVFTFAGTIDSKDLTSSCVADVIQKQDLTPRNPKRHIVDVTRRSRKDHQKAISTNRFKLVNRHRALVNTVDVDNEKENVPETSGLNWAIFDVEDADDEEENVKKSPLLAECQQKDVTCNGTKMVRETVPVEGLKNTQYVYDLYYMPDFNEDGLIYEHSFSIEKYLEPDISVYREANVDYFTSDDEDSNDENYYKNDYPDEDSTGSDFETDPGFFGDYGEEDINDWLSACTLGDSESREDDDGTHSEKKDFDGDTFDPEENYARYKANMRRAEQCDEESDDSEKEYLNESFEPYSK